MSQRSAKGYSMGRFVFIFEIIRKGEIKINRKQSNIFKLVNF